MGKRKAICKKSPAEIEIISGMFFLLMLAVFVSVLLQLDILRISAAFAEDALVASNLASAVIDIEEYGKTHVVQIAMPEEAYQTYREALRYNLQLNEQWESGNRNLLAGPVEIEEYTVYNVEREDVRIYSFGPEGSSEQVVYDGLGVIKAPDGTVVEATSVYSRICYPVKGILGLEMIAVKQKTVDIVSDLAVKE